MQDNTIQTLVFSKISQLRGAYAIQESLEILATLLTLKQLTHQGKLKSDIFNANDTNLVSVHALAQNADNLPMLKGKISSLSHISDKLLLEMLNLAKILPVLSLDDVVDLAMLSSDGMRTDKAYFPKSVMQFLGNLMNIGNTETVYCTSTNTLPMAGLLAMQAGEVAYENIRNDPMATLMEVVSDGKLKVNFSNPLMHPSLLDTTGTQLQKFNYGFSYSPFAYKINPDYQEQDSFKRFSIKTRNYEVAIIEHLLAQTDTLLCVSINANLLATEFDKNFRQTLIDRGQLKAVIYLPQGVQTVATAFLLIDPKGGQQSVRFVNLEQSDFLTKEGRNYILQDIDTLVKQVQSDADYQGITTVSYADIIASDYVWTVQKHVLSPAGKKLAKLLTQHPTKTLNQLVNFERPLPQKMLNGSTKVYEIGAADALSGYIQNPNKIISIDNQAFEDYETNFLSPKDIVVIVKGSTGKVGIVPDNVPKAGEGGWVVAQSGLVLRMKKTAEISAEALFVYLRSPAGQELLTQMNTGSVINNLSLKDLKQMPVIIPTAEALQQAEINLAQDYDIQQTVTELQAQQSDIRQRMWRLNE